ncbi:hypothetical protein LDENG_00012210 [Lucifuga dentata]|nr:hypothetical protein LDENG_00012210 [Lucifuga dentata]
MFKAIHGLALSYIAALLTPYTAPRLFRSADHKLLYYTSLGPDKKQRGIEQLALLLQHCGTIYPSVYHSAESVHH